MSVLANFAFNLAFGRFFQIRPKVQKVGGELVASSSWKSSLMSLGSWGRIVRVNPTSKTIRIRARLLWGIVRTRRIQFDWVEQVLYSYSDYSVGSVTSWVGGYQESDCFTVSLELKTGEHLKLFRFYGQGGFVNDTVWPDWMYWEDILETRLTKGDQEDESLAYAEVLSQLIGVPLGNPEP